MAGSQKVALVTGASRGLGAEIALALGRAGFRVAVNFLRNESKANDVAKAIRGGAFAVKADVGTLSETQAMADEVRKKWGRLDVLVNNAAISRDALLIKLPEADWDETMRINLKGCFNTIQALSPLIAESVGGHIINVSSRAGLMGNAGQAAYASSKAALLGLTLSAAAELGPLNIRVNALLPGYMPTDMGKSSPRAMEKAAGESHLSRLASPAEAASFVLWLAGTENITGQVFTLDSRSHGLLYKWAQPPFNP